MFVPEINSEWSLWDRQVRRIKRHQIEYIDVCVQALPALCGSVQL